MLVNDSPGVRVADTTLEEIGKGSGQFRLTVWLKTWQIFTALGFDNQGANAVGPYEAFGRPPSIRIFFTAIVLLSVDRPLPIHFVNSHSAACLMTRRLEPTVDELAQM